MSGSEIEPADQGEINRKMALVYLLNPDKIPFFSLSEEVQRLIMGIQARFPTPGLSPEVASALEAMERKEKERQRALDIASENRAKRLALEVEGELDQGDVSERVQSLVSEMLSSDALDAIPELPPVVEGLLYRSTVARMNGKPGAMKSFVALDIAAHVGTGMPWASMPVTQGPVVYIVAEGAQGIRKRVRAWEQQNGRAMENVHFLTRPIPVASPEWLVLQEAVREIAPSLVVVDTQARATVGIDESSNEKMSIIFDRIERLARECDACCLLIHHTGHSGDHGRGASAMLGAVQTEISVKKEGKKQDKVIIVKGEKSKDDDDDYEVRLLPRVVQVDGMAKRSGAPETSVVLVPEDKDQFVIPGLTIEASIAVQLLDRHDVPPDLGRDAVRRWLRDREIPAPGNVPLASAIRHRKHRGARQGSAHTADQVLPSEGSPDLS